MAATQVAIRILTESGAYLAGVGQQLLRGIIASKVLYASRHAVIDGYLVRARRADKFAEVVVVDQPGFFYSPRYAIQDVDGAASLSRVPSTFVAGTRDRSEPLPPAVFRAFNQAAIQAQTTVFSQDPTVRSQFVETDPNFADYTTILEDAPATPSDVLPTQCTRLGWTHADDQFFCLRQQTMPAQPGLAPATMQFWSTVSPPEIGGLWGPFANAYIRYYPFDLLPFSADEPLYQFKKVFVGLFPTRSPLDVRRHLSISVGADWVEERLPEGWFTTRALRAGGTAVDIRLFEKRLTNSGSETFFGPFEFEFGEFIQRNGAFLQPKTWLYPVKYGVDQTTGAHFCHWLLVTAIHQQLSPVRATYLPGGTPSATHDAFGCEGLFFQEIRTQVQADQAGAPTVSHQEGPSYLWDPRTAVNTQRHPKTIVFSAEFPIDTADMDDPTQYNEPYRHEVNFTDSMAAAGTRAGDMHLMHCFVVGTPAMSTDVPPQPTILRLRFLTAFRWRAGVGLLGRSDITSAPLLAQDYRVGKMMEFGTEITPGTTCFINTAGTSTPDPLTFAPTSSTMFGETNLFTVETEFGIPVIQPMLVYFVSSTGVGLQQLPGPPIVGYAADHYRMWRARGLCTLGPGRVGFLASTLYNYPGSALVNFNVVFAEFTLGNDLNPNPHVIVHSELVPPAPAGRQDPKYDVGGVPSVVGRGPGIVVTTAYDTPGAAFTFAFNMPGTNTWRPFNRDTGARQAGRGTTLRSQDWGATWEVISDTFGSTDGVFFVGNGYYSAPVNDLLP
jgi:hypothetical protein